MNQFPAETIQKITEIISSNRGADPSAVIKSTVVAYNDPALSHTVVDVIIELVKSCTVVVKDSLLHFLREKEDAPDALALSECVYLLAEESTASVVKQFPEADQDRLFSDFARVAAVTLLDASKALSRRLLEVPANA